VALELHLAGNVAAAVDNASSVHAKPRQQSSASAWLGRKL
jgi:hypothetical protein